MSDFFKSAFGYISGSTATRDDNDFVGQTVELGNQKLRVRKIIAEGKHPHPPTRFDSSVRDKNKEFSLLTLTMSPTSNVVL